MGLIYKITNPSGKIYVGQTSKTAHLRTIQYKSVRRKRINITAIISSIEKYGWDAHFFEVIEDGIPNELLNEREIYWIAELKTYYLENKNGLNLTKGGDHRLPWKKDYKRVERAKTRRVEKAPSWGKRCSEETKKKIAKSVSRYNKENGIKPSAECHRKAKEKQYVPVVAYDCNGDFVAEYPYLKAAADALGLSRKCVVDAANGKQKHAGGYFFRRKEEGYPLKIDVLGIKLQVKKRSVICYMGEDVVEFANSNEAAKALGLWHQTIKDSANLNKPLRNGYRFVYKDQKQNRPHIVGHAA
jgi:group I intron endonuclease